MTLGVIIRLFPERPLDPIWIRAGFVIMCLGTYFLSHKSSWVIKNLARIILIQVFLYIIWLTYLIVLNQLDTFTGAVTFFSILGICLVFTTPRKLLIFLILYAVFLAPIILSIENPIIDPYIFITLFVFSGALGYLILEYIILMQKKLQRSNNDFRTLVDSIQDSIFLLSRNYRVIKVNRNGEEILQRFFSRTIKEGDYILDFLFDGQRKKFQSNFDKALEGESVIVHSKLFSKDDVAYWFEFKYIPVRIEAKEIRAVLFSAVDITDKKASAELMESSEKRFRTVFEAAPVGMAILTLDGFISDVNASFSNTLGFRNSSVLQKDLVSLIHPEKMDYTLDHLSKLKKKEFEEFQGEMEVLRENGSYLHTITRVARISNLGKSDFLLAQIVDISQLKESEDRLKEKNLELEKANAELDKFVYSAAHDLRAPLTSVLGLINLVKSENGSDLRKYIDLIEKSITKLDYFIKDVIDYSRNSRLGISAEAINIKSLIEKTFEYHNFIESGDKISKQILIDGDGEFYSDQGRLEIILNNIISNAIKYFDPKKKDPFIKVSATIESHGLSLEISDNGIGIPPENLDKIFNIFYRGHEQSKGSGLGLYIVKETVEKINGVIMVESELNKGTSFKIRIPNTVLEDA